MIGNNFPIKTITENCGNKHTTIPHNSPNEHFENFEEFCF